MTSPSDPVGPLPGGTNHNDGIVNGPSVQAGSIHGGVHFHAAPVPPTYVHRPPYAPGPTHVPVRALPSPASAFLRKWGVVLLGPMLIAVPMGGVVDAVLGPQVPLVRVLGIAVALGVAFLVLYVVAQFAPVTVDGIVERCTPKALAALPTTALWWWLVVLALLTATGLSRELPRPVGDPRSVGTSGALTFLFVLIIMVVCVLLRRRR
ncbi:hypothetical protein ACFFQW_03850 [Umezawaea endophytica]|uniref:Uncharacterized protein n=1 Tax=Umezawaea endophytica TaxID=1654476 RepID=A0A9X2VM58_9PSEU|nr:hypothetical protein [Umezawaea endophytica]MCS7479283.1 hypothetical protein [Umezawaea endophytica]